MAPSPLALALLAATAAQATALCTLRHRYDDSRDVVTLVCNPGASIGVLIVATARFL